MKFTFFRYLNNWPLSEKLLLLFYDKKNIAKKKDGDYDKNDENVKHVQSCFSF